MTCKVTAAVLSIGLSDRVLYPAPGTPRLSSHFVKSKSIRTYRARVGGGTPDLQASPEVAAPEHRCGTVPAKLPDQFLLRPDSRRKRQSACKHWLLRPYRSPLETPFDCRQDPGSKAKV